MKKLILSLAALCLSAPVMAMTEPPVNTATQPVPQEEYDALVADNSRILILARDNIPQPGAALLLQTQNMAVQRNAAYYSKLRNNYAAFVTQRSSWQASADLVCAAMPGKC